jgi:Tfp pilus assembly protein PilV
MAARRGDRGETLLELVVAMTIMAVGVVAVTGGITLALLVSDVHRKQAVAAAYARDYAEAVESAVAGGGYQANCSPAYPATVAVPSGFSPPVVTAVSFWNGSAFPPTCSVAGDQGVQRLTVRVSSSDGRAAESLVLVVRKPCGPGSSCS